VNNWLLKIKTAYWTFQGRRKYRRKQYSEALTYFENVTGAGPVSSVVLAYVGFCLARLERYDEALESYQRALQGNATFGPPKLFSGLALTLALPAFFTENRT